MVGGSGTGVRDLASHGVAVRGGADFHSGGLLVRRKTHPEHNTFGDSVKAGSRQAQSLFDFGTTVLQCP